MTELLTTAANNWRAVLAGLQPRWPVLAVAMALEVMRPGKKLHWPTVIGNIIYIPVGLTLGMTVRGTALHTLQGHVPQDLPHFRQWAHTPARQIGLWLLYLACFDFLYYWLHRAQHQVPWLWRYHMVHHSDVNVCAASVGRHHWLEEGFRFFIITGPLIALMGGAKDAPAWVLAFIVLNGILMHWNVALRFGPLERCIITPAYHRIHHSIEGRHYDRNFGVFTQLWDHVFGTRYVPRPGEYPETGITQLPHLRAWALLAPWPLVWLDRRPSDSLPGSEPATMEPAKKG